MNAKTYIFRAVVYVAVVVLAVLVVNYTVDPYGITGAKRIAHFNQYKVDINDYTRLMKKYQPQTVRHNALILGNSRAEMGIDPSHRCFTSGGLDVYNLAMPGADVRTQLAYGMNIINQQPVQHVFLSVDFIDFISTTRQPRRSVGLLDRQAGELKYLPSGKANPAYQRVRFVDYYKSLFSLDALISSVKTVSLQGDGAPDRDVSGFNPARDFKEAVRVEGPRALFDQKMQSLQSKYGRSWYLRDSGGELAQAYQDIADFLDVAAGRGISVSVFTHPFHHSYWDLMQSRGLMPLYEEWMAAIEAMLRAQRSTSIIYWDFSGDSQYIHEILPPAGEKSGPLKWFWEPAHYRRELGDIMVDAMLSGSCDSEVSFGRQVM